MTTQDDGLFDTAKGGSALPVLVLASSSPRRQELLRGLGLSFEVRVAAVPELHEEQLTGRELAQLNAHRKARAVARLVPEALVLGADTLVCLGNRLFGKPTSLDEARGMLEQLQGRIHEVVTGVCLIHASAARERLFAETTRVTFRPLSIPQINDYLSKMDPLDKAGAYAIQQHGDQIVSGIDGSYTNVVGLPTERVQAELSEWRMTEA